MVAKNTFTFDEEGPTYKLLLRRQHLRPSILLIQLGRHVGGSMLLQTPLHAVDAATAHLQATVDGGRVEARLEQLFDVRLHFARLFACAGHRLDICLGDMYQWF